MSFGDAALDWTLFALEGFGGSQSRGTLPRAHTTCSLAANIDELSGSVCLDVINQAWSPMFDMVNIFEVFLPQLLRYPNAADPLNGEAAALLMRDPKAYDAKVKGEFFRAHFSSLELSVPDPPPPSRGQPFGYRARLRKRAHKLTSPSSTRQNTSRSTPAAERRQIQTATTRTTTIRM